MAIKLDKPYLMHKAMRDVCFMVFNMSEDCISGVWTNISSADPKHHFPIERETINRKRFVPKTEWVFYTSSEEARASVRELKI